MPGISFVGKIAPKNTLPFAFKTTHDTDGLKGWGAVDVMRPAGTIVGSPVSGTVTRWSGSGQKNPNTPGGAFGYSYYIRSDDGRMLFLTHFADRFVRPGTHVTQGQPLGRVAPYGKASHIHLAVQGLGVGVSTNLNIPRGGGGLSFGGASRALEDAAGNAVRSIPGAGPILGAGIDASGGAFDAAGNVWDTATAIPRAISWVANNWDRIFEVLGGSLLTIVGLALLAKQLGAPTPPIPGVATAEMAGAAAAEKAGYDKVLARAAGRARAEAQLGERPAPSQRISGADVDAGEVPF